MLLVQDVMTVAHKQLTVFLQTPLHLPLPLHCRQIARNQQLTKWVVDGTGCCISHVFVAFVMCVLH